MLTGYNTDVSYEGEIFHIQTEDKGIHSPIILSLVYRAGTILAAKRTSYGNLIENGVVDESAVSQLLNRQHHILVAAIQAGKSEKLAELSRQYSEQKSKPVGESHLLPSPLTPTLERVTPAKPEAVVNRVRPLEAAAAAPRLGKVRQGASTPVPERKKEEACSFDQIMAGYLQTAISPDQLRIELLYPSKFRAGDEITVRLAVFIGGHNPAPEINVQLQILGTKITAQSWLAQTDLQGLVSFNVKIPVFTSGAAALIIKATSLSGQETEAKFMISQK
jgi:hypothetical protein